MLQARQQLENAHLSTAHAFTVRIPSAPTSKKQEYGMAVTEAVSKILKSPRSRESWPYLHTQREKFGSVTVHGLGPQIWEDKWKIRPNFSAVYDTLIPTDTNLTMDDMGYWAAGRRMSPGNLYRKTIAKGDKVDPGWNLPVVRKVLDSYKDQNTNTGGYNWTDNPEQMTALEKQNSVCFDRDSIPKVKLWDFYYQSDEDEPCWYRCMILDSAWTQGKFDSSNEPVEFIYRRKQPYADNLSQIIHFQFADGNTQSPYTVHAIRGLGYILFDTLHLMNRLRCQVAQRVFDDIMHLFSLDDPPDRSRLDQIDFGLRYGIIPAGLRMLGEDQRSPFDKAMVEMQMANFKQLLGEGSAAYNQELDNGTPKERTAFEVQTLLAQGTKLTASILNLSYIQEVHAYQEICRRLTLKNTPDFTAKKFQNELREAGIPEKFIDAERWEIEPERVLGGGNTQLELAQAQGLYAMKDGLGPEAQQRVKNKLVFAITHDPKEAQILAPLDGEGRVTNSIHDAQSVFGTLMRGIKVDPMDGLNPIETTETILACMNTEIQRIKQMGAVGTPMDVVGLMAAAQYVGQYIQRLSQDKAEKARVKQYSDILGNMMNDVKAFAQRQQEAAQKQNGQQMDPAVMAKIQGEMAQMQIKLQEMAFKLQAKEASHQQKMIHKQQDFEAGQQRDNLKTLGEVQRESMLATAEAGTKKPEPINLPRNDLPGADSLGHVNAGA